jgi:hypothetical protein
MSRISSTKTSRARTRPDIFWVHQPVSLCDRFCSHAFNGYSIPHPTRFSSSVDRRIGSKILTPWSCRIAVFLLATPEVGGDRTSHFQNDPWWLSATLRWPDEAFEVPRTGHAKRRTLPMPPFSASACAFAASASGIMRSTEILNFPFAMSSASKRMLAASGWEPKASTVTVG